MIKRQVTHMGMPLDEWVHESCTAHFGVGPDWATLYDIRSTTPGKLHATWLLIWARVHYEILGKKFASSVALNDRMRRILKRLEILEYLG